jgi:hypothetical protein
MLDAILTYVDLPINADVRTFHHLAGPSSRDTRRRE